MIRVPCFIKLPGRTPGVASPAVVEENVNLVGLSPTVLSLLGLEIPETMQTEPFLGPGAPNTPHETEFYGTRLRDGGYLYAAIKDNRKLIIPRENFYDGEYYDLETDRYEQNPLPFDETAEELRAGLIEWVETNDRLRESSGIGPAIRASDDDLKALGYIK